MKFNEKYNGNVFLDFLNNFLPEDFEKKEKDINLEKNKFQKIITVKELGYSNSLDLYVLEMDHNSENDPRITIATEAFKILATHWIHRALVIFKNNDTANYRFSYLTISLDLNDKNKVVKKYSNARRYSFYLGPNTKIKTPEQQLVKLGKVKDTNDLFNRFSVEVVNEQFYFEVAKFFDQLVLDESQNLSLPGGVHADTNIRKSFVVRLIGRIMFCWFLKQKKSSNGQLVSDELLSSKAVLDNYYHNILEPLFFGVLNTNISARDIRNDLFDKVPYLNGGLFNPQTEDFYELDRGTFSSKFINTLRISDLWFKSFFELLETYNFTIDENTSFDQELSVDPEMLGKIFENLLAKKINTETNKSEQSDTGSFYTPRLIVDYMVDQSLIEYFKTKTKINVNKLNALVSYDLADDIENPLSLEEKLEIVNAVESLKILDPACGSGAFPIGALQKVVYVLQRVDPDCIMWLEKRLKGVPELYKQKIINDGQSKPFDYTRKLDVIKNSIFGVDIQPIAVDVSRLRCFLTLVVEAEIDDTKPNRGIDPLPNLDFKFVCANSLISAPEQVEEQSLFGDDFQEKLTVAVDKYFSSSDENKRVANNEIHKLIDNKVDQKLNHLSNLVSYGGDQKLEAMRAKTNKKQIEQHSRILVLWSSYKNIFENKPVDFFEPRYFFPSVKDGFDIVIGNPPYGVSIKDQDRLDVVKSLGKVPDYEIYYYFIELAKKFLVANGINSYIIPNTFLFNVFASEYRKNLLNSWGIKALIDCTAFKLFKSATVYNVITLFSKTSDLDLIGYKNTLGVENFEELLKREVLYVSKEKLLLNNTNWGLVFKLPQQTLDLIQKIKSNSQESQKIFCVSQGYIPYRRSDLIKKHGKDLGNKIVDERGWHSETKDSPEFIPEIYGKSLGRYSYKQESSYFKYGKHVASYVDVKFFNQRRLLVREITNPGIIASIVEEEAVNDPQIINIINKNPEDDKLKLMCGILNSKLATFYHFNASPKATKGGFPKILIKDINEFPIPKLDDQRKAKVTAQIDILVNEIHKSKKNDPLIDTTDSDSKIDEMVMDLYDLNDEEKEIIRNS